VFLYNQLLLNPEHRDRIDIVLVRPRNPLNIGAAARAMANFGFSHLTVVGPYAPHWQEARSAIGASALLRNAKSLEHLSEAVAGCMLVAGTGTLDHRRPAQRVVSPAEFGALVEAALANVGRVALVFGPEKHGLTRDDLSFCHVLVEIPTDSRQPSMNLGQAVAVCLYELARSASPAQQVSTPPGKPIEPGPHHPAATSGVLDLLAGVIEETMTASGYSPAGLRAANRLHLRELLRRLTLDEPDAKRILRLFRRVLWRLGRVNEVSDRGPDSH